MKFAVTGPDGFIAWHARCAIRARWGGDAVHVTRDDFADPDQLARRLASVDAIIHLAGVNRSPNDQVVRQANPDLARRLVAALDTIGRPVPVVYGNSIQSIGDTPFGDGKREAAEILSAYGQRAGAPVVDVVLPNIFGEWGRPFYNSVVATFAHQIARGQTPRVEVDRELPLLHVQRAVEALLDAATSPVSERIHPPSTPRTVTAVLNDLHGMAAGYRTGDLPDLSHPFTRDLFNTYRSFTFPQQWPVYPELRSDDRGELAETVRSAGGQAQVFFSRTRPSFTRGQHFHLRKVERFVVLRGQGVIRLRRLFDRRVVEFPVSGDRPAIVDMPTMWVHSITNVGDDDLVTLFFADELLDMNRPDTFPEEV